MINICPPLYVSSSHQAQLQCQCPKGPLCNLRRYIELDFGTDSPGSTWQRTRYHLRQERSCTDSILFDGAVNLKPGIISVSPNVLRGWIPNGGALKFEDPRAFLNFEL